MGLFIDFRLISSVKLSLKRMVPLELRTPSMQREYREE